MDLSFLAPFVDANKIGGWVRAGVAALLTVVIGKFPGLGAYFDPATQMALGVFVSGIAVGIWSQLTKTDSAKIAAVAALPEVTKIVVNPVSATSGAAMAAADTAQPKVST